MEETTPSRLTVNDLTTKALPTWCNACGNFNILHAIKSALVDLQYPSEGVALFSGIGCGSKLPHYVKTYGFEGLHGRGLPVGTGAKLANKDLKVIIVAGDGDTYGIGGNHFIHSMRRNLDITLIVQDNAIYGLTKGQYSPTSRPGMKTPSSPFGALESPVNPVAVGLTMGATYVARGYSYEATQLRELIANAIKHKGFSLVDVLQPCSTFNKINTIAWFKEHLYKLEDSGYSISTREEAMKRATESGDKMGIGLFFKEDKPSYEEQCPPCQSSPIKADINDIDISPILKSYK